MERREAPEVCETPCGRVPCDRAAPRASFEGGFARPASGRARRDRQVCEACRRALRLPALHISGHCRAAGPAFPPSSPRGGQPEKSGTNGAYFPVRLLSRRQRTGRGSPGCRCGSSGLQAIAANKTPGSGPGVFVMAVRPATPPAWRADGHRSCAGGRPSAP
jgi:hypothetical protein